MISVGIDVSKGKSTVCILKPNEDFVCKPFELLHNKEDLELLDELLQKLDGEVKVVMEATPFSLRRVILFRLLILV